MTTELQIAGRPARVVGPALIGSLGTAVLALLLFSWLAMEVFAGHAQRFDDHLRSAVHQLAFPELTRAMLHISVFGSPQFLSAGTMFLAVVFLLGHWRRATIWLLLSMGGALVLDTTMKLAFHRPRPNVFFGTEPHSYSFPSGHALASFCFYMVVAGLLTARIQRWGARLLIWLAAALAVACIGFSRIYLGVHYPSDVIAGYAAAALWVSALVFVDRLRYRPFVANEEQEEKVA